MFSKFSALLYMAECLNASLTESKNGSERALQKAELVHVCVWCVCLSKETKETKTVQSEVQKGVR